MHYAANTPTIVYDEFAEEVIIVHLHTGHYFSIDAMGFHIWRGLQAGRSEDEISAQLTEWLTDPPLDLPKQVQQFILNLLQADLIRVEPPSPELIPNVSWGSPPKEMPFQPPQLHQYDDMQNLLLLDPIHEVDPSGWPHQGTTA